jgi:ABC-2 type transport system permease protein
MFGNLVRAEYRKVFSIKLWWALLIPAVVIAFLANFSETASVSALDDPSSTGPQIPSATLALSVSFAFTCIFATLLGSMAVSGEHRHHTITTTYLTAGSRGAVLGAKCAVYGVLGLGYGVLTMVFSSLGALAGAGADGFPNIGSWLVVSLVGVLLNALWTVLGVGLGALVTNQIAVVLGIALYVLPGQFILDGILAVTSPAVADYLPVGSSSDTVISVALSRYSGDVSDSTLNDLFNSASLPPWWATGLVFLAWTAVFVALGHLVGRRKDVN